METKGSYQGRTSRTVRLPGRVSRPSILPPQASLLRRSVTGFAAKDIQSHKIPTVFDFPLCPHLPLFSLPDVAPRSLSRLRHGPRLFCGRDLAWIPVWLSEGSRREFGRLACIVSAPPGPCPTSRNAFHACSCFPDVHLRCLSIGVRSSCHAWSGAVECLLISTPCPWLLSI